MAAALGLTCRDAFVIFSQNETLQLQRENTQLKARLARYEPTPRSFETYAEYCRTERTALAFLNDWLHNNVNPCSFKYHSECGSYPFFERHHLMEAFENTIYMITNNRDFAWHISGFCLDIAEAAIHAAHTQNMAVGNGYAWYADERVVALVVYQSLTPDTLPELIRDAVEYPLDSDDEFT